MATLMLLAFIPAQSNGSEETKTVATLAASTDESAVDVAQLARLEEIREMDMTTLSRSEKKELRSEVRAIKDQQDGRGRGNHDGRGGRDYNGRHHHGVFVFGGGGLLLIILLVILL
jgi:hypothetical protein